MVDDFRASSKAQPAAKSPIRIVETNAPKLMDASAKPDASKKPGNGVVLLARDWAIGVLVAGVVGSAVAFFGGYIAHQVFWVTKRRALAANAAKGNGSMSKPLGQA